MTGPTSGTSAGTTLAAPSASRAVSRPAARAVDQERRGFLGAAARALAALAGVAAWAAPGHAAAPAGGRRGPQPPHEHPAPRPGVTADRVVPDAQLADFPEARPAFAEARQIPQVLDGIRCHCVCTEDPAYRSVLTCFEGEGMARHCEICRGQARLAYRLHRAGQSLDAIRAAVDARYG